MLDLVNDIVAKMGAAGLEIVVFLEMQSETGISLVGHKAVDGRLGLSNFWSNWEGVGDVRELLQGWNKERFKEGSRLVHHPDNPTVGELVVAPLILRSNRALGETIALRTSHCIIAQISNLFCSNFRILTSDDAKVFDRPKHTRKSPEEKYVNLSALADDKMKKLSDANDLSDQLRRLFIEHNQRYLNLARQMLWGSMFLTLAWDASQARAMASKLWVLFLKGFGVKCCVGALQA